MDLGPAAAKNSAIPWLSAIRLFGLEATRKSAMMRLNRLEKLLRSSISLRREKSVGRRGDLGLNCSDGAENSTLNAPLLISATA